MSSSTTDPEDIHTALKRCLKAFDELLAEIKEHRIALGIPQEPAVQRMKEQLQKWASDFGADLPCSSKLSLDHKFRNHSYPKEMTLIELRNMGEDIVNRKS
ncbi:hypothetical protein EDB81DRAFT_65172 [Dactylonectria macrodidyma]|uniref:Uncharacterized protein n=1 Tax=Dactylonectria macrodidyma TaxID=307937 RepID=A0A9P9EPL3_9HYPO|nr:hypothetical protein EDB81DRAFT_65172 [Dactylonectria macrodidyma]